MNAVTDFFSKYNPFGKKTPCGCHDAANGKQAPLRVLYTDHHGTTLNLSLAEYTAMSTATANFSVADLNQAKILTERYKAYILAFVLGCLLGWALVTIVRNTTKAL